VEAKRKADEAQAKAKEARNAVPSVSAAIQQAVIQLNHDQKESSAA
jgi:hypothetical protein